MSQMLRTAAGEQKDPTIVINADAKAPHQAVINIMEAAASRWLWPYYLHHQPKITGGQARGCSG